MIIIMKKNLLILKYIYIILVGGDNLVLNFVCPHFYLFNNDFMHILYDKCVLLKINICCHNIFIYTYLHEMLSQCYFYTIVDTKNLNIKEWIFLLQFLNFEILKMRKKPFNSKFNTWQKKFNLTMFFFQVFFEFLKQSEKVGDKNLSHFFLTLNEVKNLGLNFSRHIKSPLNKINKRTKSKNRNKTENF